MAPTVRAVGTVTAGSAATPLAVGTPAGFQAGDLLLAIFEDQTGAAGNHVTLATWTELAFGDRAAATGRTTMTVMGKISDGTEGASQSFALAGTINHWMGRMIAIQNHGLSVIGDVVVSTVAGGAGGGASPQTNTITGITVTADSLIVICGSSGRDIASTTEFSNYTNANLTGIAEQMDNMIILGTGGGFCMATGTCAGTTTGNTTYDQLILYDWNAVQLGVKPAAAAAVGPPFRRWVALGSMFDPWSDW
jgi:hypothetical protein